MKNKNFSLVLSGGAALGCAHLGAIEALEQRHLVPGEIVGASMGAIVGAAYAFGYSTEAIAGSLEKFSGVTNWIRPSWSKPSFFNTEKVSEIFSDLFSDQSIRNAKIPLKIVATDFESGRARVFTEQDEIPVKDALLCSMSIPVLFPPVAIEGRMFVDGFLCANLPVEFAIAGYPVIAVDVMSIRSLPEMEEAPKPKALLQAYERTFCLLVHSQTRAALARRKDVVLIEPELAGYHVYDFDEWDALRHAGMKEAEKVLDAVPS